MADEVNKTLTLFGVLRDGGLLAMQENPLTYNLPQETLSKIPMGKGGFGIVMTGLGQWSWSITSVKGFSGQPQFQLIPSQDTNSVELRYSGIDPLDWEHGATGTIQLSALHSSGESSEEPVLTIKVGSIDFKDLTFYTPQMSIPFSICKGKASTDDYTVSFKSDTGIAAELATIDSNGIHFSSTAAASTTSLFDSPVDEANKLKILHADSDADKPSLIPMRLCTRPLRYTDENGASILFAAGTELELTKDQDLTLEIDGDAGSNAGYSWEITDFDPSGTLKLSPSFETIKGGSTAVLKLKDESEWDWMYGSSSTAALVVRDGTRPEITIPFTFGLKQTIMPIHLKAGTLFQNADGIQYEVIREDDYYPVVDTTYKEIRLEGVPVRSVEGKGITNLPYEEVLTLVEKQPLLGDATVTEGGLTMGDDPESDEELRKRVSVLWANPPAHGNRSHLFKIASQVEGVDRAFVYPSFALEGHTGLGYAGLALVGPGRYAGVGAESALAKEVHALLEEQGSYTGNYVMMNVHTEEIPVHIQIKLEDELNWSLPMPYNFSPFDVIGYEGNVLTVRLNLLHDHDYAVYETVTNRIKTLKKGTKLYWGHVPLTVNKTVYDAGTSDGDKLAHFHLSQNYSDFPIEDFVGIPVTFQMLYPDCPERKLVQEAVERVFADLGTSEAAKPEYSEERPWQRRFPRTDFMYPDELRIAELYNQVMDIPGVEDMRLVTPLDNLRPSPNEMNVDEDVKTYTTYVLVMRNLVVGPYQEKEYYDITDFATLVL